MIDLLHNEDVLHLSYLPSEPFVSILIPQKFIDQHTGKIYMQDYIKFLQESNEVFAEYVIKEVKHEG